MYAHNSLLFMLAKLSFSVGCGESTLSNKKFVYVYGNTSPEILVKLSLNTSGLCGLRIVPK